MNGYQLTNHQNECTAYDHLFSNTPRFLINGSSQQQANANSQDDGDPAAAAVSCDYFGGVYEYIRHMLMEEDDLDHRPCMFQDCSALQAAEKYFHDALRDKGSGPPLPLSVSSNINRAWDENPDLGRSSASGLISWSPLDPDIHGGDGPSFSRDFDRLVGPPGTRFEGPNSTVDQENLHYSSKVDKNGASFDQPNQFSKDGVDREVRNVQVLAGERRTGKSHSREAGRDCTEERSSKQLTASYENHDPVQMEKYDKSLLCPRMNPGFYNELPSLADSETSDDSDAESKRQYRKTKEVKRGRPKGSKKNRKVTEVVDLRSLLSRCAEAVATFNIKTGEDLLKQIRSRSSPYGDADERLAHCFANALEARMAGTGSSLYAAAASRRIAASELLKSYQAYVTVCPFKRMSNIFANKTIGRYSKDATKLHIIDFGIFYGFQWPCIIQGLSLKPGGPPRLRITGIDYPQPGFRPAERVEQTGRRLADYCKRFNVSFEYDAVAKNWEDISIDDLKIERDEMLVVNCLYRLRHVPDESASVNSPRDSVLGLIRAMRPDLFVHGVVNGTYNAPFFPTRFREALFHYSSSFDMMEATLPREDRDRVMYEREVFGRDVMNAIACEGSERVERPESYKQWQVRNQRAGFRQLDLVKEIVDEVKVKVRSDYHGDFLVEEDGGWLLQGWKGRVMYALSCWRPFQ